MSTHRPGEIGMGEGAFCGEVRPKSSLGKCLSSWIKGQGHLLIALAAYFDSSWVNNSLVTLAGFAAEDSIWFDVDTNWNRILSDDRERPAAKYLHMREAAHLEREFSPRNGWNLNKVGRLIVALLEYVQTVDKERFHEFACTVDLVAYRKLISEGYVMDDPIDICNRGCPEIVLGWYAAKYPGVVHSAHYFFDQGEPFRDRFEKKWNSERAKKISPGATDYFWSLIKSITTADMRDRPGLQVADLFAWARNRKWSKADTQAAFKNVDFVMTNIIPGHWDEWTESKLRSFYRTNDSQ